MYNDDMKKIEEKIIFSFESILKILEVSADDFDVEIFSEEFMSMPFQIKEIDKGLNTLSNEQSKRYFKVLETLKKEALKSKPSNFLQENIIQNILNAINEELKVA